jgi:hypothetical protein
MVLFWHDKWLQGIAPKDFVPNLFKLTHFKKRTVQKELQNRNWINQRETEGLTLTKTHEQELHNLDKLEEFLI